jgi:hypothetical protein
MVGLSAHTAQQHSQRPPSRSPGRATMNEAMPAEIDVPGPSNPDGSAAPAATSRDRCRRTLWFGFAGLLATLLIVFGDRNLPSELAALHAASFLHWMTISFIAGFTFRAVRRQVFFGAPMSLHRAFSFDAIFQGAILVHPQLPYPDVEREFLALQLELPPERVSPWFHIRSTSALAIPLVLAGVTVGLALSPVFGGALCVIGLVWIVYTASASAWTHSKRWRFVTAELLGVGAAVTEGAAFVLAARSVNLSVANWESFLLYAVLLTAFELSPVPLALGVLELAYLGLAGLPGLVLPGLLLPLAYRLWRATPVLLLPASIQNVCPGPLRSAPASSPGEHAPPAVRCGWRGGSSHGPAALGSHSRL